jgi:sugar lactone lactonase YvrE
MKRILSFLLIGAACLNLNAQTLNSTESVEYDPANGRFLASNGSSIIHVDGNGNEVAYFGDAEADYGMEVMGSLLYAIVGNQVIGYDLTTGDAVTSITISGAQFLNGMASDGVNRLWVTDFSAKKIHEIDCSDIGNLSSSIVVNNTVSTPNGICYDGANSRLVFVSWGNSAPIKAVSLPDYSVTTIVANSGVGNIDGIDHDNNGNFYISSWSPTRITKWSSEFTVDEIITVTGMSSPADICYAPENDTLAIPNSGNSTIKYVGFTDINVFEQQQEAGYLLCYPNPMTPASVIAFELLVSGRVQLQLMDAQGKVVATVLDEQMPAAKHKVVPQLNGLAAGTYFWELTQDSGVSRTSVVIAE